MLHKRSRHTTTKGRPHSIQLKSAYSNKYSEQPKINNFLKLLFKKNKSTSSLIEIKNDKYINEHGSSIFLIEISYHNLSTINFVNLRKTISSLGQQFSHLFGKQGTSKRGCYLRNPQNDDVIVNGNKRTKKILPDYRIVYTYATHMHILDYENNNHQHL